MTESSLTSAKVSSQTVALVLEPVKTVDRSFLSSEEQSQMWSLLKKYALVFATHDQDLVCTNLNNLDNFWTMFRYDSAIVKSFHQSTNSWTDISFSFWKHRWSREAPAPMPHSLCSSRKRTEAFSSVLTKHSSIVRHETISSPTHWGISRCFDKDRWSSSLDLASGYNQFPVT